MLHFQRVLFSDNGTLTDLSYQLSDYRSGSAVIPYVAGEDYLYIGSLLPFGHKYIELATVNDQASTISVDIWWANDWVSAVDLMDLTVSGDNSLGASGYVIFSANRLKGWDKELDSEDVTGLSGTAIHGMYWVRLSWSDDLKATTAIKYIGHKFAADNALYTFYPDLNSASLKTAFASGKTTWDEQHFAAANCIISDLKRRNLIVSGDQIIDFQEFEEAALHKAADIIYSGLNGKAEFALAARKRYREAMEKDRFGIDQSGDGKVDKSERTTRYSEASR